VDAVPVVVLVVVPAAMKPHRLADAAAVAAEDRRTRCRDRTS
jgi:hypothetical protein